jgi:hypothetical protein
VKSRFTISFDVISDKVILTRPVQFSDIYNFWGGGGENYNHNNSTKSEVMSKYLMYILEIYTCENFARS